MKPPPKAEIDRLRASTKVIDPKRIYRMDTGDGKIMEFTGANLIETAEATVALYDAQLAGDEEGIRKALLRIDAANKL